MYLSSPCLRVSVVTLSLLSVTGTASPGLRVPAGVEAEQEAGIRRDFAALEGRLHALRERPGGAPERLADAELYLKGARWALDYEERLAPADLALVRRALVRGTERAAALERGGPPGAPWAWEAKKGRLALGYVSAVDGSVQPYALIVPARYDGRSPMRLDVVLHGSTRPVGLSELRFISPFDEGDHGGAAAPDVDYLELRPLGRVENCYRWAGETDVFEAIADVQRRYRVDPDRIVLRGMSMGASGTWHLGLKHPDRFAALGPYCGYVDTYNFSHTPQPNFIPVGPLPPHQDRALHLLDSIDYAANAGMVPAVAAMGEKDVFFQAHVIMGQAMEREGLRMVNLISPGTGHVQEPVTFAEQMRRIGEHAARGRDRAPVKIRFVTRSLKYARCHWLELLGLERHYDRAEARGTLAPDGSVELEAPTGITRFALHPPALAQSDSRLRVAGSEVRLPRDRRSGRPLAFERRNGAWRCLGDRDTAPLPGKRPGLQGPIDDAFAAPFLCVRGTGAAWNPAVGKWSDAALERFGREWRRYFRGDLPVKDDTAVTDEDLRTRSLVLFGDPGSNKWIRRALPDLPLRWTRREIELRGERYPAAEHAPLLIQPNPLPGASGRYLVLNTGHSFGEKELASLNYLLFPRLGDWAVVRVGAPQPGGAVEESVARAGFFGEDWR